MVKDELLEVHLTNKLLDLLLGRSTLECAMTYPVMECTVVSHSGPFEIGERISSMLSKVGTRWS